MFQNYLEAEKLINHTKDEISFEKILVMGLGQLGLPVAKYVKEKGFDVYGYDNNPLVVEMLKDNMA